MIGLKRVQHDPLQFLMGQDEEPDMQTPRSPGTGLDGLKTWLRSPVTVTLPGWGVAAGAAAALLLLLVALD
jgi:hypothetical protein